MIYLKLTLMAEEILNYVATDDATLEGISRMRIILAGGGSGGHVTPLKAIYDSLKNKHISASFTVITDHGFRSRSAEIFAEDDVAIKAIFSGKYRRYHSRSFLWHIIHLPTLLANIKDLFLLIIGTIQMLVSFVFKKPDVIFCKGGFVCVPVGVAARLFNIPMIIHDSDTRPGLTNRILSRWAKVIATGMPVDFYPYEASRTVYTGIPVKDIFKPVKKDQQKEYKEKLGLDDTRPLLLVTGGGNGALSLNKVAGLAAEELLSSGWSIIILTGQGKSKVVSAIRKELPNNLQKHWIIEEFADMAPRLLAADVVIARTSASTIQECANAKKRVIGIPSPHLDDQKMNAEFFGSKRALLALDETKLSNDGNDLVKAVKRINDDNEIANILHSEFAKPIASDEIADLIIKNI